MFDLKTGRRLWVFKRDDRLLVSQWIDIAVSLSGIVKDCVKFRNDDKTLELCFFDFLPVIQGGQIRLLLSGLFGSIQVELLIVIEQVESEILVENLNALLYCIANGYDAGRDFDRDNLFFALVIVSKLGGRPFDLVQSEAAFDFGDA